MIPEPLGGQRESRPRCESVRHRGRRRDVTINSCAVGGLYKGVLDSGMDRCGEGEWDSEIDRTGGFSEADGVECKGCF